MADSVTTITPAEEIAGPRIVARRFLAQAGLLVGATIVWLLVRRPDQFFHPTLWDEDTVILQAYVKHGWWSILEPVAGYYVFASKIIALVAFKTSFLWAPQIALVLIVALICAVMVAVALSPTHLPWPFMCAVAVLAIPTDSEVFAVSEYAFWWAGVLLLVALFWRADCEPRWLRWLYIVFGGLSSPIIVTVAGLLVIRATVERKVSEYFAVGIAIMMALIQSLSIQDHVSLNLARFGPTSLILATQKFIGFFFDVEHTFKIGPASAYVGFVVLFALILIGWSCRTRLNGYFYLLVLTYLAICATIILRYPVEVIHPLLAGPRYFFYPFILLSWIMIFLAARSGTAIKIGFALAFLLALINAGPALTRRHDPINWKSEVAACAQSASYNLPIHFDGKSSTMWHVRLTGQECHQLLDASLF